MAIDGRARRGVQSLEFTRGRQVVALDVKVDDGQWDDGDEEDRRRIGNDKDDADDIEARPEERAERPRKQLVNRQQILAEAIHDATKPAKETNGQREERDGRKEKLIFTCKIQRIKRKSMRTASYQRRTSGRA